MTSQPPWCSLTAPEASPARRPQGGGGPALDNGAPGPAAVEVGGLTGRELEVLRLLATGASNAGIGGALFISPTTVKFHVSNIMRKLAVSRRAEAVYAASESGLI